MMLSSASATKLDIVRARSHFPALRSGYIFADNAGGSQIPHEVVDRISDYLLHTNVQLNVDYSISKQSTARVAEGLQAAAELFNAASTQEVTLGPSSTSNMINLLGRLEGEIRAGDEFILMDGEHEANNGCWKKLAERRNATLRYWHPTLLSPTVNPCAILHKLEHLLPLITSRTRIVAFSACSNILGSVTPIKEIVRAVRETVNARGARRVQISVDCVAYAPHRRIDVRDWDIDFCLLSFYKVYGPHAAALYTRSEGRTECAFSAPASGPVASELVYGATGILSYLQSLTPSRSLDATFDAIVVQEQILLKPLLSFLTHPDQRRRGVMVVGEEISDSNDFSQRRVPTVSFVVQGTAAIDSREIVKMVNRKGGVGIRWYNYSCLTTGNPPRVLPVQSGVARISLVHYNTVEEVHTITAILDDILSLAGEYNDSDSA